MATESLIIEVKEKGGRVVKRNIEDIGGASHRSATAITVLKRAIVGLSATLALRQVGKYGEAWIRVNNSLKSALTSSQSLVVAQRDVLQIARDARSPLEQVASLYAGISAASNELNVSQQEIATFTQLASKAIAVQGSSTGEAAGALLQLRQAIGGSVIQAQEFNSLIDGARPLLEAVAAGSDRFGGSVNKLREEVRKGTVTSKEFFDAALKGSEIIDQRFSKTTVTAAQALTILNNELIKVIGSSKTYQALQATLGAAIIAVADNLETIGLVAGVAGAAIVGKFLAPFIVNMARATKAQLAFNIAVLKGNAIALGSAEAGLRRAEATAAKELAAQKAASIASIKIVREAAAARVQAARTAGAAEISAAKASATADLEKARSAAAVATSNLNKARSEQASAQASLASATSTRALVTAERELEITRLRAQITAKGRQLSLSRMATLRKTEVSLIQKESVALKQLEATRKATTAAQVASTSATAAATTASTRATATITAASAASAANIKAAQSAASSEIKKATAQGATAVQAASAASKKASDDLAKGLKQNTLLARAGATAMKVLTGAIALVGGPIAAIGIALAAAGTALVLFADKIKIPGRQFATLEDVVVVTFKRIQGLISPVTDFLSESFTKAIDFIKGVFPDINISFSSVVSAIGVAAGNMVLFFIKPIDTILNLFLALKGAIGAAFDNLDTILSNPLDTLIVVATKSFNGLIDIVQNTLNTIVRAANVVSSIIDIEIPEISFPKLELPAGVNNDALNAGEDIAKAFSEGLQSNVVESSLVSLKNEVVSGIDSILNEADQRAKARQEASKATGSGDKKPGSDPVNQVRIDALKEINRALEQEVTLLQLTGREREVQNAFLQIENSLRSKGITLSKEEASGIQAQLQNIEALRTRSRVLEEVTGAQETMNQKIMAFNQLLQEGAITQQQVSAALLDSNAGLFDNTLTEFDGLASKYEETLTTINQLRDADVISEQTASKARLQAYLDQQNAQLDTAKDFFGNISALQNSENKKIAAVGRAAAIAQATINTYQSATAAYAAMAGIPYIGPALGAAAAAAAIAAGLANVAKIRSSGNRALGGDANPTQLLRVGENNRPELFRGDSGKQFFIPPERGRVEPLKARPDQPAQAEAPSINVPTPQVNMTNVNFVDPDLLEDFLSTPRGDQVLVNRISRNSSQISPILSNGRG